MKQKVQSLEALRALAAIYVLLHHTLFEFGIITQNSIIGFAFKFGQEAVITFFLLSGFVIALSLSKNDYKFKTYFLHRFLRIYPIIIVSWILSYISVSLINGKLESLNLFEISLNLLMLQDLSYLKPGVIVDPLFGNNPLWSLSYEWWFYMIFFMHYLFIKHQANLNISIYSGALISVIGAVLYSHIPNNIFLIFFYYQIWFTGALIAIINRKEIARGNGHFSYLNILIALILPVLIYFLVNEKSVSNYVSSPFLEIRHYISAISLFTIFMILQKHYTTFFQNTISIYIIRFFSRLAPISFGIYVFHYPIKEYMVTLINQYNPITLLLVTIITTLFFSYIFEKRMYSYIKRKALTK